MPHLPPTCPSCAAPLPRAAANRCPGCRRTLASPTPILRLYCRRCGSGLSARPGKAARCEACRARRPSRLSAQG